MRKAGISLVFVALAALLYACWDSPTPSPGAEPCNSDDDCFSDEICVDSACEVSCSGDADCRPDGECVDGPDDKQYCVGPEACSFDAGCAEDEICVAQICEASCTANSDCPEASCIERPGDGDEKYCGTPAGDCTADSECFSDEICVEGNCEPVCVTSGDCNVGNCVTRPGDGDEKYCGTSAVCNVDTDCFSDEICVDQICQFSCTDDGDCATGGCVERPGDGDEMYCDNSLECTLDADCPEDAQICYEGDVCVETCTDDNDCSEGESCSVRDDSDSDDSKLCVTGNNTQGCTNHDDCDGEALCQIDTGDDTGECVLPEASYETVLIEDVTAEEGQPDRCDNTTYGYDAAGAKPFVIELWDGGDRIASAETVDFIVGDNANFGDPYLVFDGTTPPFEHTCPDPETFPRNDGPEDVTSTFHEDSVVALGCGGQLFVQFYDENGLIALTESHQIDVYTYGQTCSDEFISEHSGDHEPQEFDDPYIVDACSDSGVPVDVETCDASLSDNAAFGIQTFDVELP